MSFLGLMVQSVGALALVLAIFAGLVWGLRRFQDKVIPHKEGKMHVVQRLHIDSKNSVVEMQYGEQHYLLGVGQGGVQKIAHFTPHNKEEDQDVT